MTSTLYHHETGPLVQYANGVLHIADLNPEVKTQWRMSRMEMLAFGWRCIIAGIRAKPDPLRQRDSVASAGRVKTVEEQYEEMSRRPVPDETLTISAGREEAGK